MRILRAGLAGGLALNVAMVATFRLVGFGWNGGGILLDPTVQSRKLIAVWTELEPLPLVVSNPLPIVLGLMIFGVIHAVLYSRLAPAWRPGVAARAVRFAGLVFVLSFSFWEFFTPFNQLGEPARLIALELAFWAVIALVEGFVMAFVFERAGRSPRGADSATTP